MNHDQLIEHLATYHKARYDEAIKAGNTGSQAMRYAETEMSKEVTRLAAAGEPKGPATEVQP